MFLSKENLKMDLEKMPEGKGVYLFFNLKNEIIYIGCSFNLRQRIIHHVTYYNSLFKNPRLGLSSYAPEIPLIAKRLDQVKRIIFIEFDEDSKYNIHRLKEKRMVIKYRPKYNGEFLRVKEKGNFHNEVKLMDNEVESYLKYYEKATLAFHKVMASRFKEKVVAT